MIKPAGLLAAIGLVAGAAASAPTDDLLTLLRTEERRVATVGFRLATANVVFCRRQMAWPGLGLHAAAQYRPSDRSDIARFFGLGQGIGVIAVIDRGPADRAGLREDDQLVSVNGRMFADSASEETGYAGLERIIALLQEQLDRGPARVMVRSRDGTEATRTIEASNGCRTQLRLQTQGGVDAEADGDRLIVNGALVEFSQSDDELAIAMGHELAHNILEHGRRLDAARVDRGILRVLPGNARRIRATEREADFLGLYLAARAGYDIRAAPGFWRRFGRQQGVAIGDGSHPSSSARAKAMWAEIAEIESKRSRGEPLMPAWPMLSPPPNSETTPRR